MGRVGTLHGGVDVTEAIGGGACFRVALHPATGTRKLLAAYESVFCNPQQTYGN